MPFSNPSVTVGVTPTLLFNPVGGSTGDPVPVVIFNNDPTVKLFIGGPTVTVGNGFPVIAQSGVGFRLIAGDAIYGIVAAATLDARVLTGRQ